MFIKFKSLFMAKAEDALYYSRKSLIAHVNHLVQNPHTPGQTYFTLRTDIAKTHKTFLRLHGYRVEIYDDFIAKVHFDGGDAT